MQDLAKIADLGISSLDHSFEIVKHFISMASPDSDYLVSSDINMARADMHFRLEEAWLSQLDGDGLPKSRRNVFYHVCLTSEMHRILEHGIYHDKSPTLTPYLPASLFHALNYYPKRPSSILIVEAPLDSLFFVQIDDVGPGYLPKAFKLKEDVIPGYHVPESVADSIFRGSDMDFAYWLSPEYIKHFHTITNIDIDRIRN